MMVYLTLKLDFNIKQQQMASPKGGGKINLDVSQYADCVQGERRGDEMRTTRSATNNEEEKKNSTWRRKVLGVLGVTRSHSAVCVRTEKERFQSGNARGEKESESCEATCFKC